MILQTPLPNMPPDPGMIIAVFGMMTGVVITGFIALGPVGRAIGDIIRHWLGGGRRDHAALQAGDVDEIVGRLDTIQHQLGELAERQDFAERVLAQSRKERQLPGGSDVAG